MPRLREWQCLAPRYWNEAQLGEYINDCTVNVAIGMAPVVQICSPQGGCNVLLAVLAKIAMENRQWVPGILDSLAQVAESLDALPAIETPRVH